MKTINIIKEYYGDEFEIFKTDDIDIEPGLNILVGCNGYGKTTFLKITQEILKQNKIPYVFYSDLHDGRNNAMEKAGLHNTEALITLLQSSEGESLIYNFGSFLETLFPFIKTGINSFHPDFSNIFSSEEKEEITSNERWVLIDAIDSGTSIDNLTEIINVLKIAINHAKQLGKEMYILISTNNYEFARNNNCIDVVNGYYVQFKDYEDYRKFILNSAATKMERYKKEGEINNVS